MNILEESIQDMIDAMNIVLGKEVVRETVVEKKKEFVKPVYAKPSTLTDEDLEELYRDLVF